MKIKYMKGFKAFSGKMDELVYCVEKSSGAVWAREYVLPRLTENNRNMGLRSSNLSRFYLSVSPGYKQDLEDYSDRLNLLTVGTGHRCNASALVNKIMYALKRKLPELDLTTITPTQVMQIGLPVRTVREAVEAGLIPIVPRYDELENLII